MTASRDEIVTERRRQRSFASGLATARAFRFTDGRYRLKSRRCERHLCRLLVGSLSLLDGGSWMSLSLLDEPLCRLLDMLSLFAVLKPMDPWQPEAYFGLLRSVRRLLRAVRRLLRLTSTFSTCTRSRCTWLIQKISPLLPIYVKSRKKALTVKRAAYC